MSWSLCSLRHLVQDVPHLPRDRHGREQLPEQHDPGDHHAVPGEGIIRVARGVEDLHLRPRAGEGRRLPPGLENPASKGGYGRFLRSADSTRTEVVLEIAVKVLVRRDVEQFDSVRFRVELVGE